MARGLILDTGVIVAAERRKIQLHSLIGTVAVARAHAYLMTHTRQRGRPRGAIDLMVAATASATGRTLITTDAAAGFGELPGITAEVATIN